MFLLSLRALSFLTLATCWPFGPLFSAKASPRNGADGRPRLSLESEPRKSSRNYYNSESFASSALGTAAASSPHIRARMANTSGSDEGQPPSPPKYSLPQSSAAYGDYGNYPNHWNGQYYPYASYGYSAAVLAAASVAPYFLVGPYGFFGPYGVKKGGNYTGNLNATVNSLYVNGTKLTNGTWVNGTLFLEGYADGEYVVTALPCSYSEGVEVGGNIVVNGTGLNENWPAATETRINPNLTAHGSKLNDAPARANWAWQPALLAAAALLL